MPRPNLKRLLASDKLKAGHSLFEFSTPGIGQILGATGIDFVFIDMMMTSKKQLAPSFKSRFARASLI